MYHKALLALDPIPRVPEIVVPIHWRSCKDYFELDVVLKVFDLTLHTYNFRGSNDRFNYIQDQIINHVDKSYIFQLDFDIMQIFIEYVYSLYRYFYRFLNLHTKAGLTFMGWIHKKEELPVNSFGILAFKNTQKETLRTTFFTFIVRSKPIERK